MVERRQPNLDGGDDDLPPVTSSETSADEQETYIIQIHKEQIFSTPPPENSIIAERYRNPEKKERGQRKRLSWVIATFVVIVALVGIIIGATHIIFNPKVPSFSIHKIVASRSSYLIELKSKNENGQFGNSYGKNGDAILLYKGHKIGKGKFPEYEQDADSSVKIELRLKGGLSKDIKEKDVELRLEMKNVAVKMNVWSKVIDVVCNFKVTSVRHNIISQQCQSNFH